MRLALFEPDIPQNAGTLMRLAACLDVGVDLIEPAGFVLDDRRLRRALMDYVDALDLVRAASWAAFEEARRAARPVPRLVLLSRHADTPYTTAAYRADDILLVGRESAGVPDAVRDAADLGVHIPMRPPLRSINVATAAAMVLGEALRQTRWRKDGTT